MTRFEAFKTVCKNVSLASVYAALGTGIILNARNIAQDDSAVSSLNVLRNNQLAISGQTYEDALRESLDIQIGNYNSDKLQSVSELITFSAGSIALTGFVLLTTGDSKVARAKSSNSKKD